MNKITKNLLSLAMLMVLILPFLAVSVPTVSAVCGTGDINGCLTDTGLGTAGSGMSTNTNLPQTIGRIITFLLSFLGIVAVILILYAGFMWMTAGGDTGKVDKAQAYIKNAVIGIVIILSAYVITSFIFTSLTNSTTGALR